MLIVKDMSRLAEFGFKKSTWVRKDGLEIWEKALLTEDVEPIVSLLVNPYEGMTGPHREPNEMVFYVSTVQGHDIDADIRLDELMELINAGVVEYIADKKRKGGGLNE